MIAAAKAKKRAILADKITSDNIYKALVHFDKLYDKMNEAEKREFVTSLISKIHVFEERQPNGQWLKSIEFKLPIINQDMELRLDNDDNVETVVLLNNKNAKPKDHVEIGIDAEDYYKIKDSEKEK